jgi:hypothetical protein
VARPLVWGVLWFVPLLLVRSPVLGQLRPVVGAALTAGLGALFLLQAISNLAAARATARSTGFRATVVATAIAVVRLGTVVAWLCTQPDLGTPGGFEFSLDRFAWPLTLLLALVATLAWSQRTPPARYPDPPGDR